MLKHGRFSNAIQLKLPSNLCPLGPPQVTNLQCKIFISSGGCDLPTWIKLSGAFGGTSASAPLQHGLSCFRVRFPRRPFVVPRSSRRKHTGYSAGLRVRDQHHTAIIQYTGMAAAVDRNQLELSIDNNFRDQRRQQQVHAKTIDSF